MEALNIKDVFIWLYASGGSSAVLSVVFERWDKFQALSPKDKEYTFVYYSIFLSLCAWMVVSWVPVEILNTLAVPFTIVVGTLATALFGKLVHKADNISTK